MSDLQVRGPIVGGAGSPVPFTASIDGSQRVNDAHGRFMDAAIYGRLFTGGMTLTSISNVTFTTGTLGATCTPIVGVWNPSTSPVNLVVQQATLGATITALNSTGGGPYVWAVSVGNGAISTGSNPFNCKTLQQTGSYAKFYAGTALTGLTNNLVVMRGSSLGGGSASNAAFTATAVAMQTTQQGSVENLDGGLIIPPGGVLALLATTTPVALSASSGIVWEELPIVP